MSHSWGTRVWLCLVLGMPAASALSQPPPPLPSGTYVFRHRYAEQPHVRSFSVLVKVRGRHVLVINPRANQVFPAGTIAEGRLVWNVHVRQWIIASHESERLAREVGGCSGGPEVIDIGHRIYWTC